MASKKKSADDSVDLMSEIAELPTPVGNGSNTPWWVSFEQSNPGVYQQLVQLIEDHHSGGQVRAKFPSQTKLYNYLAGKDKHRPRKAVIHVGRTAFRHFYDFVTATENDR